jgi:hypothetical protein
MKQADIQKGNFYIGGKRQRIREVLVAHEIWVDWRDIDPETVDFVTWLGQEKGQCSPKTLPVGPSGQSSPRKCGQDWRCLEQRGRD